jgi:APA family basic amino acid/polyamine antiporter
LRRGDSRGRIIAVAGLCYSIYALVGTGREALAWGAVLLLAGLPVYLWMRRKA